MKQYKIFNKEVLIVFDGYKIGQSTSNPQRDEYREKWTDFEIYIKDDNEYVVNVVSSSWEGELHNRSFVCRDFGDIQKCLTHPVYGELSYAAQRCYKQALATAIKMGLTSSGLWEIGEQNQDGHKKDHAPAELPDLMQDDDLPDFDFSED